MQEKVLLNNTDMTIEFNRQNEEKCVMAAADTSFKLHIKKAILHIRRVELSPEKKLNIEKKLSNGKNAIYNIPRYFIFTKTIPQGVFNEEIRHFNIGDELPRKIIVVLTDQSAYNGNLQENPFNFKHFNLSRFNVVANGQSIYGREIECNFANNQYTELYMHTMMTLDHLHGDGCGISLDDYGKGYAIFGADLTPSLCGGDEYTDPIKTGALEVNFQFSTGLANVVTAFIYCEYESTIQIDANRDVIKDYVI